MKDKNYEFIEHTADVGIKVRGKDLRELFKNSALAMFDIIAEKQSPKVTRRQEIKIEQKADDLEELLVNWLNELLSLSAAQELIFLAFKITKLDKNILQAIAVGQNIADYKVNSEIKAATYHELEIKENKSGWEAKIIFDV